MIFQNESLKIIEKSNIVKKKALKAIEFARINDFLNAEKNLEEGEKSLKEAFVISESIFQNEIDDDKIHLLLIHAMDVITYTHTIFELSAETVELYKRICK